MTTVQMSMPPRRLWVAYGNIEVHSDPDGTFNVPRYMVPSLVAAGCMIITPGVGTVDVRAELAQESAPHLGYFLDAYEQRSAPRSEQLDDDAARSAALTLFDELLAAGIVP